MTRRLTPVVLCGDAGRRLWPLDGVGGRPPGDGLTLPLARSLQCVSDRHIFTRPMVVCAESVADAVAAGIAHQEDGAVLVVLPVWRGTAPALAAAAAVAAGADPDATLLAVPCERGIADGEAFVEAALAAARAAGEGRIAALGVAPTWPGGDVVYLRPGAPLAGVDGAFALAGWIERPQPGDAARCIAEGCFWYTGLAAAGAGRLLEVIGTREPVVLHAVRVAIEGAGSHGVAIVLGPPFGAAPVLSMDDVLGAVAADVALVPARFEWQDMGGWSAWVAAGPVDADGNALAGPVVAEEVRNAFVLSRGVPTAVIGVEDVVVIATPHGVLVSRRDAVERVPGLVDRLHAAPDADDGRPDPVRTKS